MHLAANRVSGCLIQQTMHYQEHKLNLDSVGFLTLVISAGTDWRMHWRCVC